MRHSIGILQIWLIAGLVSCSSIQPYPASWGEITDDANGDCSGLDGTYSDRGEIPDATTTVSLTSEIFGHNSPWPEAERVVFSFEGPDLLTVTAMSSSDAVIGREFSLPEGGFSCQNGWVVLTDKRFVAADVVVATEEVTIDLRRNEEFLIARVQSEGAGTVAVVIPIAGKTESWYRFARLPDE